MRLFNNCFRLAAISAIVTLTACGNTIQGTKIQKESTLVGVIKDAQTGKGIPGIAVTDGTQIVQTDRHGVYQMRATERARTVCYTTPASYEMAVHEDGSPAFFAYIDTTKALDRHDFTLRKLPAPEEDFTLVVMADPQCMFNSDVERFRTETVPDVGKVAANAIAGTGKRVYGIGLGDIVYDNLTIWEPMSKLFRAIPLEGGGTLPVYNIPGNHDHCNKVDNEYDAVANYIHYFGPTDYSFDRGKLHFICMDNIIFLHKQPERPGKAYMNCAYEAGFTPQQLAWLRRDISLVQDKGEKMVVLCTHAPFRGADKKGFKEVLGLLTQFKDAELLIGHTHHPEIYRHDDFRCQSGRPIKEHIHGAVCGAWWHANICVDGTPSGYAVYQVSGDHFTDYTARFTGLDEGVQLRVYNGNQSYSKEGGYTFAWEPEHRGKFIATVWYADPVEWTVEFIDKEGHVWPMDRVKKRQRDWAAYSYFLNVAGRDPKNTSYQINKLHYWTFPAPGGDPAAETGWTVRATQTSPTGQKKVYTCNRLQTGYEGF